MKEEQPNEGASVTTTTTNTRKRRPRKGNSNRKVTQDTQEGQHEQDHNSATRPEPTTNQQQSSQRNHQGGGGGRGQGRGRGRGRGRGNHAQGPRKSSAGKVGQSGGGGRGRGGRGSDQGGSGRGQHPHPHPQQQSSREESNHDKNVKRANSHQKKHRKKNNSGNHSQNQLEDEMGNDNQPPPHNININEGNKKKNGNGNNDSKSRRRGMTSRNNSSRSSSSKSHQNNNDEQQQQQRTNFGQQRPSLHKKSSSSYSSSSRSKKIMYPEYTQLHQCLERYNTTTSTTPAALITTTACTNDNNKTAVIRGKLRVMPGGKMAFISCDRGLFKRDVVLDGEIGRNRALDGDLVFVEIIGASNSRINNSASERDSNENIKSGKNQTISLENYMHDMKLDDGSRGNEANNNHNTNKNEEVDEEEMKGVDCNDDDRIVFEDYEVDDKNDEDDYEDYEVDNNDDDDDDDDDDGEEDEEEDYGTWQDDEVQKSLWDPLVKIHKRTNKKKEENDNDEDQYMGRVIHIIPPKILASEINPTSNESSQQSKKPRRTIVGTLMCMPGANSTRYLLVPSSRSLPRFMTPASTRSTLIQNIKNNTDDNDSANITTLDNQLAEAESGLYSAEYIYGSWTSTAKWAPCINLKPLGRSCNVEDETMALLMEHGVNHGEFHSHVLREVEGAVESGRFRTDDGGGGEMGWKPTKEMYKGRRDYRKERIFTIDPTTAKDLDDALHVKPLPDGRVEIGVHIADVSHFVTPNSEVDKEASLRTTTVYLVDRVIPMLPRPLCEIACSLNENVERLAFSCVWTMNMDGTLCQTKSSKNGKKKDDVWYGRTVIKSCARLDYATAQNIIDKKVANGEKVEDVDASFWPKSRQPTGGHTIDEVAGDVRLMHKVAMARRKLRFQNGALALNGVKLAFELESDGETPALCAPYPIRDSNRLIEEYMLMANYLVAQRLITHTGALAVLRQHSPPLSQGIQSVIDVAKSLGYEIDGTTSQTLQASLSKMGRECTDELVMKVVTEMMMNPMRPAEYIAAGNYEPEEWCHFALNIPYYTHFTSPIRRYPDVLVHRLLQATIDGEEAVKNFELSENELQSLADHCNDKRMASKKAQERSDRVFLSLYLKANPIASTLGVVVSIGEKAFTVFVPSLGLSTMVFLDDHKESYQTTVHKDPDGGDNTMTMIPKQGGGRKLDIHIFAKLTVACNCKEKPPIDVTLRVAGIWTD